EGDFPVAEECAEQILSLPMFPELSREEIEKVVSGIKAFFCQTLKPELDCLSC
ncbi:MAG: DegT/DnrJ/EryC1/StrS family aminotransferase, partial [bacterium]